VLAGLLPPEQVEGDATIELDRVYEDEQILVINKPAGLVMHPGSGNRDATLMNALLGYAPHLAALPRAGIVHRLDKETSGLLVVAKTLVAQTDLVRQLQARSVQREYLAIAHGRIEADGKIDAPIGRHPTQRTRMAVVARGRPAITYYGVLRRYAHATSLCCRLETGRTHQIRVHLQKMGHPLVGDPVYGKNRNSPDRAAAAFKRQALHARRLALRHPASGELMSWQAPTPTDIEHLLATLEPGH
jgi:23S rRNA pseudouridine1911/1915/1917 synthase